MTKQNAECVVSRRIFLGGLFGSVALTGCRMAGMNGTALRAPNLRLGLISDIHICAEDGDFNKFGDTRTFEHALAWFRDQGVDGVVLAGDMADNGMVAQLKKVGEAWDRVFPNNRAPDGRVVEKLFVYGNHDLEGQIYDGYDQRFFDKSAFKKGWIKTDPAAAWEQVFHEPYAPIWMKRVKGYQVIGAHWVDGHWDGTVGLEDWFKAHVAEIDRDRPIFFIQHPHPKDTCFGPNAWGHDAGYATRALSAYPKAVAFSGHAHWPATDDRFIWQEAFTSIGLGSLRYGSLGNVGALMNEKIVNDADRWHTRQGMLLDVYDDEMVLKCRDFVNDEFLREEMTIPIPEKAGDGIGTFAARAARMAEPVWPTTARLAVKVEEKSLRLSFPTATGADCRVIAYVIEAADEQGKMVQRFAAQPNGDFAAHRVGAMVEVGLPRTDFPANAQFKVIPVNSLGKRGAALVS